MLVAKPLSHSRTCASNMGKTEGCVYTTLRKTNPRDLFFISLNYPEDKKKNQP